MKERRFTADSLLNARRLAEFMGFDSDWTIRAVKKANRMAADRGEEKRIFTGRYSTSRRVLSLHNTDYRMQR